MKCCTAAWRWNRVCGHDTKLAMVLIKKTEKTPPKDLELARARKAEFEANKKKATPQKP